MPEVERPKFKQGCLQVVAQSRCKDAPTTNDHDCRDAKQTERSLKGKGDGDLPYFLHSLNPFWYVILYHFRFVSSTALAKHHILPPLEKGEVD